MKRKNNFIIYSIIWAIAIVFLIFSLYHNMGMARVINYTGIIRGGTQRLVKQELQGNQNDKLIQYLDDILNELQTGQGKYDLLKNDNTKFQNQLKDMSIVWNKMQTEIDNVRNNQPKNELYTISEQYFDMANKAVGIAEDTSNEKVQEVIYILIIYLILSLGSLLIWNAMSNKKVHNATYFDPLTGLLNLAGFQSRLDKILKSTLNSSYVLVDMDIDNFKYFNDTYSYDHGNKILSVIAKFLKHNINEKEGCARLGSNNFILLLEKNNPLLKNFRIKLNKYIQSELQITETISFSTGAIVIDHEESITTIMDKANIALKSSKASGGNHVVWYDEKLMHILQKENTLTNHMEEALKNREFQLYLQPKFNIHNQKTIGAEALVRWVWNETMIMPDEFISLFEKKGFIIHLDFYMLTQTCELIQDQYNQDKNYNIPISVNFSRVSLLHKDFLKKLQTVLTKFNFPLNLIEIEVTESAFNEIADAVLPILEQLKSWGIALSMDDFGTGYSSLSLLMKLPMDSLKLDKGFLMEKTQEDRTKKILSSLVDMAHKLDLRVICEGVEKKEDIKFLKNITCDYGQGYYFSRPIPKDEFINKYL